MASEIQPTYLEGFVVPDPRLDKDCITTAPTQAGQRPSVPEYQRSGTEDVSPLVLSSVGDDEPLYSTVYIQTGRSGGIGIDKAGFWWRTGASAVATTTRGRDAHNSAREVMYPITLGTSQRRPHAVKLDERTLLVAYQDGTTNIKSVTISFTYDASTALHTTTVGSAVTVATDVNNTGATDEASPCLIPLGGDRIACFYYLDSDNVGVSHSFDRGATWSQIAGAAYTFTSDSNRLSCLRGGAINGVIALFACREDGTASSGTRSWLHQLASTDYGATWTAVKVTSDTDNGFGRCDVRMWDGRLNLLTTERTSGGTNQMHWYQLSSAWQTFTSAENTSGGIANLFQTTTVGGANAITDSDVAIDFEGGGRLAIVYRQAGGNNEISALAENAAGNIGNVGDAGAVINGGVALDLGASTHFPEWLSCVYQGSRLLLFAEIQSSGSGSYDGSLVVHRLGGWSTLNMPSVDFPLLYGDYSDRVNWAEEWAAGYDLPDNMGWTLTTAGTPTVTESTSGYVEVSTGTAETNYYTINPSGTLAEGLFVEMVVKVTEGGDATAATTMVGFQLEIDDATDRYQVDVNAHNSGSTTTWTFRDAVAGSTLGSVTRSASASEWLRVYVAITGAGGAGTTGEVSWGVSPVVSDPWDDDEGALNSGGASITRAATSAGVNRISWGNVAASSGTSTSQWRFVAWASDDTVGQNPAAIGLLNYTNKRPADYATTPVYVTRQMQVMAYGGPATKDETYTVVDEYDYGAVNVLPSVSSSPSVVWRSRQVATDEAITFSLTGDVAEDTRLMGPIVGLYLGGINWAWGEFGQVDNGGSYTKLFDINAFNIYGAFPWTRNGTSIYPSAASNQRNLWVNENDLAGSVFSFADGTYRTIKANSEGLLVGTNYTAPRCTIVLEGVTGSEATSGAVGHIFPRDVLYLFQYETGVTSQVQRGFKLLMDGTSSIVYAPTGDGYFEIGTALIGDYVTIGSRSAWGRTIEDGYLIDRTTTEDGRNYARTRNPRRRRRWSFAWNEGVSERQIYATSPDPDYILGWASATAPATTMASAAQRVRGVVSRSLGDRTPVVWVPIIDRGTQSISLAQPGSFVYGRFDGPVRSEPLQGNPMHCEVGRIGTVAIIEEV